jgi:hypothetical protein
MGERFNDLIKSFLRNAFRRMARSDLEVVVAMQRIAVLCVPDPVREATRSELGLLGELAAGPCRFEVFHKTPDLWLLRDCLHRQLAWHDELERRAWTATEAVAAEPGVREAVPFPWLIVVSTERPETVLEGFGFQAQSLGVYGSLAALQLRVVVLSELPRTRSTLILRLMGTRRVLREALQDLMALPEDAWERSIALPHWIRFGYQLSVQLPKDVEDGVTWASRHRCLSPGVWLSTARRLAVHGQAPGCPRPGAWLSTGGFPLPHAAAPR